MMDSQKTEVLKSISQTARLFKAATQIDITIVQNKAEKLPLCRCCRFAEERGNFNLSCDNNIMFNRWSKASSGAKKFFVCPCGFLHFAVPIIYQSEPTAVALSSPVALSPSKESAVKDFLKKFNIPASYGSEIINDILSLSDISAGKIGAAAEMLSIIISGFTEKTQNNYKTDGFFNIKKEILEAIADSDRDKIGFAVRNCANKIINDNVKNRAFLKELCIEFVILLGQIAEEVTDSRFFSDSVNSCLIKLLKCTKSDEIDLCIFEISRSFAGAVLKDTSDKYDEVIQKATEYIKNNYMNKITLESVAAHVYLSPSYLSRIFKEKTGQNFNGYLNSIRVSRAKQMLSEENADLVSVSIAVGYDDRSYFSKVFKRITGLTPHSFKASNVKN